MNPKLRSDSVFTQLTNEQIEQLEDWLFEEKLSYKDVIEKMQKEFGVKTSQTALGRYFRRLAEERTQEWRVETIAQCLETLATAKGDGTLQAGLFAMANMHAVRLMTEEKPSFREITGWLRAMTSAGTFEMKRVEIYESREKQRLAEIAQKEKEAREKEAHARWSAEYNARSEAREAKRKATIAAKKAEKERAAMTNEDAKVTPNQQGSTTINESAHAEPERRLAAGLAVEESPNDERCSSPEPAREPALAVVPGVSPPNGSAIGNLTGVTRDEIGDFSINRAGNTP